MTEKIADFFQRTLLPMADLVLDFHSGGRTLDFVPFAACHVLPDKAQEARCIAARDAFAAPYAMTMLEIDAAGMYDSAAEALGKTFVTTELGGGGTRHGAHRRDRQARRSQRAEACRHSGGRGRRRTLDRARHAVRRLLHLQPALPAWWNRRSISAARSVPARCWQGCIRWIASAARPPSIARRSTVCWWRGIFPG